MPKKKKTLKQKQLADNRRLMHTNVPMHTDSQQGETETVGEEGNTFSLPASYAYKEHRSQTKRTEPTSHVQILTHEYKYLGRDLLKTAFLTGSILIVEIIIRFIFERG